MRAVIKGRYSPGGDSGSMPGERGGLAKKNETEADGYGDQTNLALRPCHQICDCGELRTQDVERFAISSHSACPSFAHSSATW